MSELKQKVESLKNDAAKEVDATSGAVAMVGQFAQQIQGGLRAAQMDGVPPAEQSVAIKYLKPLLDFCNQAQQQMAQRNVLAQGRLEAFEQVVPVIEENPPALVEELEVERASRRAAELARDELLDTLEKMRGHEPVQAELPLEVAQPGGG
jgi:hypothetical protein